MGIFGRARSAFKGAAAAVSILLLAAGAVQSNPLAPGWTLSSEGSSLRFQSIKNMTKIETSSFATFSGRIEESGVATVKIALESVDTGVDLRNVRMRFLFFETFKHPFAVVRMQIDPASLMELPVARRMPIRASFDLELHGIERTLEADLIVTLIDDDTVSVAPAEPILINVADFDLEEGVLKLQDAAKVTIVPTTSVSFDFVFVRDVSDGEAQIAAASPPVQPSAALETVGEFSREECVGRFEILSRSNSITFQSGSAALDAASTPFLVSIMDIVRRCPRLDVEVAGHTDDIGPESLNQSLSEARAATVAAFLVSSGIEASRLKARGYGESRPAYANDGARNRALNRRIEFSVQDERETRLSID